MAPAYQAAHLAPDRVAAISRRQGPISRSPRDFISQGAANVASGLFRGLPVGGSPSPVVLSVLAGARSLRRDPVLLTVLWVGYACGLVWSVLAAPALVVARVLFDFFHVRLRMQPDGTSEPPDALSRRRGP